MPERCKILIVDDEPLNVDFLEQELQDLGYETVCAVGGLEALAKAAAEAPDLILLDLMLPDLDGWTVCRLLKEQIETQLIPVVMMTALGAREDRIRGIEAGADDFLTKPVHSQELLARIKTTLRQKYNVDQRLNELRSINTHLAKFVPEAVKRLVAANPKAPELALREQDVSILFVDISEYTRLSEQLSPHSVNVLVERYFSAFLDLIHEADGDINETAGDGFMAIFMDVDAHVHARKAVDAALTLLAASMTLNRAGNAPPLSIHMGVNSGIALVGAVRFEGFRGARWTFTASGPTTNLAARLAEAAEANQLLAGPRTVRRLGDRYCFEKVGRQHLKNLADALDVYRILGPSS
ncbi:MAG: response regulator [Candidatus Binatia bacterium]